MWDIKLWRDGNRNGLNYSLFPLIGSGSLTSQQRDCHQWKMIIVNNKQIKRCSRSQALIEKTQIDQGTKMIRRQVLIDRHIKYWTNIAYVYNQKWPKKNNFTAINFHHRHFDNVDPHSILFGTLWRNCLQSWIMDSSYKTWSGKSLHIGP